MSHRMTMSASLHDLDRAIADQIKDGGVYLGVIDWFLPRFRKGEARGSLYIHVDTMRGDGFSKTFEIEQLDISVAKRWEDYKEDGRNIRVPVFDAADVVEFVAGIDPVTGYRAKHIRYLGLFTNTELKRKLHDQEWNFRMGNIESPAAPLPPLRLRSRPRKKENE